MPSLTCSPVEIQAVKNALQLSRFNIGIGILHEPSRRIFLTPLNVLPNKHGHAEFVDVLGLPRNECKGFGIILDRAGVPEPYNGSSLNGPQGVPGALLMPQATFDEIVRTLRAAGL